MQLIAKRRSALLLPTKSSSRGGRIFARGAAVGLESPFAFLLCLFFFLAGFYGSSLFSELDEGSAAQEVEETGRFDPLPYGSTGEGEINFIPFQVLSLAPRIVYFPNFATVEQCERIIEAARDKLEPSEIIPTLGKPASKGVRTSTGCFLMSFEDETGVLSDIEGKIAKVTSSPLENGEAINVIRYEIGQYYQNHNDAYDFERYGPQDSQRVATFLLYLSDVEEGGETMFPREGGINTIKNNDFRTCNGFKVKPRRGSGLLFYPVHPNRTLDELAVHGSCAVIKGEKWVATKWIRDKIF